MSAILVLGYLDISLPSTMENPSWLCGGTFLYFLFFSMEKKINKQMKRERSKALGGGSVKLQLRSLRQYPEIFLIKKKDFKP